MSTYLQDPKFVSGIIVGFILAKLTMIDWRRRYSNEPKALCLFWSPHTLENKKRLVANCAREIGFEPVCKERMHVSNKGVLKHLAGHSHSVVVLYTEEKADFIRAIGISKTDDNYGRVFLFSDFKELAHDMIGQDEESDE